MVTSGHQAKTTMSAKVPEPLNRLIEQLTKLPGIGPRSAERLAFHMLKASKEEVMELSNAIASLKTQMGYCTVCYNLTDHDPCAICQDTRRDHSQIVVVEQPKDLMALEETGLVRGVYHVLMGQLSPLEGVEPGHLTIDALLDRVRKGGVSEVVLATSPTLEGDGTSLYIHTELQSIGVKVTRLARGLPSGGQLEYATRAMLADAIIGRREMP
jgi:recombination protein RecR